MSQAPTSIFPHLRRRHHPKRRASLLSPGGLGGLAPAGASGATPQLVMAEPDDLTSSVIAGSITTFVHVLAVAILALLAWLAPPVEQLIQVKIIRELPGADVEPAPARKIIKPRRQRTPVQAARQVTAQAVAQPRVVNLTPQQLKMNQINKAVAPQQVRRRQVVSTRTQARSFDQRVIARDVDLTKVQDLVVQPTDLDAPIIDYDGPRKIDPGAALQAPDSFAEVPEVQQIDYDSAAPLAVISEENLGDDSVYDFDTDVGIYGGGEGTGGTGTAVGVVRCMESAYVHHYLSAVTAKTERRWRVPEGVPENTTVVLRFVLDSSGAPTHVEFVGDTPPGLGKSAIEALHAASPFPRMDDNVRCLAGKKLSGKFSVETL